jgi:sugar phosphate isomerase/epimerase
MTLPKIGVKTWRMFDKKTILSDTVEIISSDRFILFREKYIPQVRELLKGKDLSMHSQVSNLFSKKPLELREFYEAEAMILKAEILLADFLGCRELIFHMKKEKLSEPQIKTFKEILKFAESKKVQLLYEINCCGASGEDFLYNLSHFPELKVNLDLGHLNHSIQMKTFGMTV